MFYYAIDRMPICIRISDLKAFILNTSVLKTCKMWYSKTNFIPWFTSHIEVRFEKIAIYLRRWFDKNKGEIKRTNGRLDNSKSKYHHRHLVTECHIHLYTLSYLNSQLYCCSHLVLTPSLFNSFTQASWTKSGTDAYFGIFLSFNELIAYSICERNSLLIRTCFVSVTVML